MGKSRKLQEVMKVDDDFTKTTYTQEENYRAYKLFSMMDVDNGGSISLRELNRVLMGDAIRYLSCTFTHPDSGLVWDLDEEQCVIISSIEAHSSAIKFPFLVKKMKLHKIDDVVIPQHKASSLQLVYAELLKHHDQPVTFEFIEPIIIINQFSCVLDIEVEKRIISVELPIGAVYNLDLFTRAISREMTLKHPILRFIKVDFHKRKRQIFFKCDRYEFKFLFATGPSYRNSCRYALGFSADDTTTASYHEGQPMLIDLNLSITQDQLEILMQELFSKFDKDGSGEFEFEEFRDFYIKYLDSDESLLRLRDYAKHRFRDLEVEAFVNRQAQLRQNKALRRARLKVQNKAIFENQKRKFHDNSLVDKHGIRRRLYNHRSQSLVLNEKGHLTIDYGTVSKTEETLSAFQLAQQLLGDTGGDGGVCVVKKSKKRRSSVGLSDGDGDGFSEDSTDLRTHDEENIVSLNNHLNDPSQVTTIDTVTHNESIKERSRAQRALIKLKQEKQNARRKRILHKIFEANKLLNKQEYADAKKNQYKNQEIHMVEVHALVKKAIMKTVVTKETDYNADIKSLSIDVSNVVLTPALKISSSIFGNTTNVNDIDLENLPSRLMHPAAQRYFFIRESRRTKAIFDSTIKHPAFFTANYERQPSRHSAVAMSVAKLITQSRQDGVNYRAVRGMKRCMVTPLEDKLPQLLKKEARSNTVVKFKDLEPRSKYANRIIGRVTIHSVRVYNLSKIAILEKNSPFVTFTCGTCKFSTEINSMAGSTAEWDELQQTFRMHENETFTASSYTGSVMNHTLIGSHTIRNEDFIALPLGPQNSVTLSAKLMDNGECYGNIELRCTVEKGEEWDWYVIQYQAEEERKFNKRSAIQKYSRTKRLTDPAHGVDYTDNANVQFPLDIIITFVSLFDLISVHRLTKNKPYVILSCGSVNYTADTEPVDPCGIKGNENKGTLVVNSATAAAWEGLSWEVSLVSANANLIFMVYSGTATIGRFALSGTELLALQRTNAGLIDIHGDLLRGEASTAVMQEFSGKIQVKCNVLFDSHKSLKEALLLEDGANDNKYELPAYLTVGRVELCETNGNPVVQMMTNSKANKGSKQPLYDLVVQCGDFIKTTTIDTDSGATHGTVKRTTWQPVDCGFPMTDRMFIKFSLLDSFGAEYGHAIYKCAEFMTLAKPNPPDSENAANNLDTQNDGTLTLVLDVHNNHSIINKLRIHCVVSLEGDALHVNHYLEQLALAAKQGPLISGYSAMHTAMADNFKPIAAGRKLENSLNKTLNLSPVRAVAGTAASPARTLNSLALSAPGDDQDERDWDGESSMAASQLQITDGNDRRGRSPSPPHIEAKSVVRRASVAASRGGGHKSRAYVHYSPETVDLIERKTPGTAVSTVGSRSKHKDTAQSVVTFKSTDKHSVPPPELDHPAANNTSDIYPFRLTITDIIASDLKSVHILTANSPHVNIAVGTTATSTSSVASGGSACRWNGLEFIFYIHETNTIRIAAWSKNVCIGYQTIKPVELLNTVTDALNYREYYCSIENKPGSTSGKIKFIFLIEYFSVYNKPISELAALVMPTDIQPPILVTVYTIAVMNLKSVHPFSSNYPVVKGSAGLWRAATSPDNEHIGTDAKWESLMWTVKLDSFESKLKLVVLSGSIVIGTVFLQLSQLVAQMSDSKGLCEIECYLSSANGSSNNGNASEMLSNILGKSTSSGTAVNSSSTDSGMIRITYAYECHTDVFLDSDSDDSDLEAIDVNTLATSYNNTTTRFHKKSSVISHPESEYNTQFTTKASKASSSKPLQQYRMTIVAMNVLKCKSVHGIISNSPFVTLKCGDYRAVTKTKYLSGASASWLNLSPSFRANSETDLTLRVYSGQAVIGSCTHTLANVLAAPRDCYNCVLVTGELLNDGEKCGNMTTKIRITDTVMLTNRQEESQDSANFFPNQLRNALTLPFTLKIHSINAVDILLSATEEYFYRNTLLMAVSYENWKKTTVAADQEMQMKTITAEWRDSDWLFIVTDNRKYFDFSLVCNGVTLGTMVMSVEDIFKHPMTTDNYLEITGYLITHNKSSGEGAIKTTPSITEGNNTITSDANDAFNSLVAENSIVTLDTAMQLSVVAPVSIGKLKLKLSAAPYITPEQKVLATTRDVRMLQNLTTPVLIAKIRIKHIKLSNLYQVYGLFRNSPKVTVLIYNPHLTSIVPNTHPQQSALTKSNAKIKPRDDLTPNIRNTSWSCATPIAADAGSECTWDMLKWGLIPIYAHHTVYIKVTSGNELLGEVRIRTEDFVATLQSKPGAITPVVSGELFDGLVSKGNYEFGCLLIVDQDCKRGSSNGGIVPHNSLASGASAAQPGVQQGSVLTTGTAGTIAGQELMNPKQKILSLSTPTPYKTDISIVGVSVYDLKAATVNQNNVFQNSPQVRLACNHWKVETSIAQFSGDAANWIIKRADLWSFSMFQQTFLRLHVHSGSAIIGSVYISTRELVEMPQDNQGVASITRSIEKNLEITGKIQLTFRATVSESATLSGDNLSLVLRGDNTKRVQTTDAPVVPSVNFLTTQSLDIDQDTDDNGSVARRVLGQSPKKNIPQTVLKHVPDKIDSSLILNNAPILKIPLTVTILELTCLDMISLHMVSQNALQLEVQLNTNFDPVEVTPANPRRNIKQKIRKTNIITEKQTKLTSVSKASHGAHAHWENLNYKFVFLEHYNTLQITVLSHNKVAGSITLTSVDLLSMPRTAQGFTEISRNILRKNEIIGKVRMTMLLAPYISAAQMVSANNKKGEINKKITTKNQIENLTKLAKLDLYLISCREISLIHNLLYCTVAFGTYMHNTDAVLNVKGNVVFSNFNESIWHNLTVYERSHLLLTLHTDNDVIVGTMLVCAEDIVSTPCDVNGFIVIYGELLNGMVSKGIVSIACKIHKNTQEVLALSNGTEYVSNAVGDALPQITENASIAPPQSSVLYDRTSIDITTATAENLKAVHKVGKNSPSLRLEYKGIKYVSQSLPYAGSSAIWKELSWPIELHQPAKMKIMVLSSGNTQIGQATLSIDTLLDEIASLSHNAYQLSVTRDILKNGEVNGQVTLHMQFREQTAVDLAATATQAHQKILQTPADMQLQYTDSIFGPNQSASLTGDESALLLPSSVNAQNSSLLFGDSTVVATMTNDGESTIQVDPNLPLKRYQQGPIAVFRHKSATKTSANNNHSDQLSLYSGQALTAAEAAFEAHNRHDNYSDNYSLQSQSLVSSVEPRDRDNESLLSDTQPSKLLSLLSQSETQYSQSRRSGTQHSSSSQIDEESQQEPLTTSRSGVSQLSNRSEDNSSRPKTSSGRGSGLPRPLSAHEDNHSEHSRDDDASRIDIDLFSVNSAVSNSLSQSQSQLSMGTSLPSPSLSLSQTQSLEGSSLSGINKQSFGSPGSSFYESVGQGDVYVEDSVTTSRTNDSRSSDHPSRYDGLQESLESQSLYTAASQSQYSRFDSQSGGGGVSSDFGTDSRYRNSQSQSLSESQHLGGQFSQLSLPSSLGNFSRGADSSSSYIVDSGTGTLNVHSSVGSTSGRLSTVYSEESQSESSFTRPDSQSQSLYTNTQYNSQMLSLDASDSMSIGSDSLVELPQNYTRDNKAHRSGKLQPYITPSQRVNRESSQSTGTDPQVYNTAGNPLQVSSIVHTLYSDLPSRTEGSLATKTSVVSNLILPPAQPRLNLDNLYQHTNRSNIYSEYSSIHQFTARSKSSRSAYNGSEFSHPSGGSSKYSGSSQWSRSEYSPRSAYSDNDSGDSDSDSDDEDDDEHIEKSLEFSHHQHNDSDSQSTAVSSHHANKQQDSLHNSGNQLKTAKNNINASRVVFDGSTLAGSSGDTNKHPNFIDFDAFQFNLQPLDINLPQSMSVQAFSFIIASDFTHYVLNNVLSSFIAMEMGGDFGPQSASAIFMSLPPQEPLFGPHCRMAKKDIIKYTSFATVRECLQVGGTNVLRQKLQELHVTTAVERFNVTAPQAAPQTEMLVNKFRKRAGIVMNGGGHEQSPMLNEMSHATSYDDDPPSDPDEIELVHVDDEREKMLSDTRKLPPFGIGFTKLPSDDKKNKPLRDPIPMRAKIVITDVLGLDISFIDRRVLPKRPYLTACKPYGNWAGETTPVWTNIDNIKTKDMLLNFRNLNIRFKWESFLLRMGQCLVFDLHDGGSGLIFAKCKLSYEDLMQNSHRPDKDENDPNYNPDCPTHSKGKMQYEASCYLQFYVANEYGGGSFGGVVRMFLDLSVNIYVRPKKAVEYWDSHRIHHWKNFALTPINTGVVRQKYKEIAIEYDKQMIIHPAFFGFKVRFKGNPEDETRFIHPMFLGFSLAKKPLLNKLPGGRGVGRGKVNPWRYDPNAAKLGKCPICADGVAGCPRCFMMPIHERTGVSATPMEFEYNPDHENKLERERIQKEIAVRAKERRQLQNIRVATDGTGAILVDGDDSTVATTATPSTASGDDNMNLQTRSMFHDNSIETDAAGRIIDPKLELHTNLTTYRGLANYRNLFLKMLTVYIKVMPTGYIRKVVVSAKDTVWNLYHMFHSHSNFGTQHTPKLILPLSHGLFEFHREIKEETDLLRGDYRGRDQLVHYGFNTRSSEVVLLYFPNYKANYVPTIVSNFFDMNTSFHLSKLDIFVKNTALIPGKLPVYDCLQQLDFSKVPIHQDGVQKQLLSLIRLEYNAQQKTELARFEGMGREYLSSKSATADAALKLEMEQQKDKQREKNAMTLRFESQLKGMTPKQRRRALKALQKRELDKKRSVLFESEKEQQQREKSDAERRKLKQLKKQRHQNDTGDDDKSVASCGSKASLNDISLGDFMSSQDTSRTGTTSTATSSVADSDSSSDSSDSDDSSSDSSSTDTSDVSSDSSSDSDRELRETITEKRLTSVKKGKHAAFDVEIMEDMTLPQGMEVTNASGRPPIPPLFYVIDGDAVDTLPPPPQPQQYSGRSNGDSQSRSYYSNDSGSVYSTDTYSRDGSSYSSQYTNSDSGYSSQNTSRSGYSDDSRSYASSSAYGGSSYTGSDYSRDSSSVYSHSSYGSSSYTADSGYTRSTVDYSSFRVGDGDGDDSTVDSSTIQLNNPLLPPRHKTIRTTDSLYSQKRVPVPRPFVSGNKSIMSIFSNETASIQSSQSGDGDDDDDASHSLQSSAGDSHPSRTNDDDSSSLYSSVSSQYTGSSADAESADSHTTGGLFTYRSAFSRNHSLNSDMDTHINSIITTSSGYISASAHNSVEQGYDRNSSSSSVDYSGSTYTSQTGTLSRMNSLPSLSARSYDSSSRSYNSESEYSHSTFDSPRTGYSSSTRQFDSFSGSGGGGIDGSVSVSRTLSQSLSNSQLDSQSLSRSQPQSRGTGTRSHSHRRSLDSGGSSLASSVLQSEAQSMNVMSKQSVKQLSQGSKAQSHLATQTQTLAQEQSLTNSNSLFSNALDRSSAAVGGGATDSMSIYSGYTGTVMSTGVDGGGSTVMPGSATSQNKKISGYGYLDQDSATTASSYRSRMYAIRSTGGNSSIEESSSYFTADDASSTFDGSSTLSVGTRSLINSKRSRVNSGDASSGSYTVDTPRSYFPGDSQRDFDESSADSHSAYTPRSDGGSMSSFGTDSFYTADTSAKSHDSSGVSGSEHLTAYEDSLGSDLTQHDSSVLQRSSISSLQQSTSATDDKPMRRYSRGSSAGSSGSWSYLSMGDSEGDNKDNTQQHRSQSISGTSISDNASSDLAYSQDNSQSIGTRSGRSGGGVSDSNSRSQRSSDASSASSSYDYSVSNSSHSNYTLYGRDEEESFNSFSYSAGVGIAELPNDNDSSYQSAFDDSLGDSSYNSVSSAQSMPVASVSKTGAGGVAAAAGVNKIHGVSLPSILKRK